MISQMQTNKKMIGILTICVAIFLAVGTLVPSSFATASPKASGLNSVLISPAITKHTYYNWAGYAVSTTTSAPVTEAQGSWIEPAVKCNSSAPEDQAVVFWVGIDGLTSGTVEQTGTLAYCVQGQTTPEYYAWYEFYPAQDIITTSMKVTPGDVFHGTIIGSSDTSFKVTLVDVTTGAHFSKTQPSGFSGERTSAECITETPSGSYGFFLIPDFGTSKWGMDYTKVTTTCSATIHGKTKPIGSYGSNTWELTACNYSSCTITIMQPSKISTDKTSFTLTWKNEGP